MCRILSTVLFLLVIVSANAQQDETADTIYLNEVEVFGRRIHEYPVDYVKMKDFSGIVIKDVGDFLRREPNISGIRRGGVAVDPVVRGFKYNQVTVLLNDGVKIEGGCPNRMDPVAAHVESDDIEKIEIVKGPYVLKYGPVMGALVNLRTIYPSSSKEPYIHGKLNYGFESNWNGQREHLELTGGGKAFFFRISGGFKGYGSYTAGNDQTFNTSFRKSYAGATAGFSVGEHHIFFLSWQYNQGNDVMFPALPMDERLDKTQVMALDYTGFRNGRILNNLRCQVYFSPVHHVMDNFNRPAAATMRAETTVDAYDAGGKLSGEWKTGFGTLITGLDYEYILKDGTKAMSMRMLMGGDTFYSAKSTNVYKEANWCNTGIFGEYRFRAGEVQFTAAVRFDLNQAGSSDTFRLVREGISYFDRLDSRYFNVSANAAISKEIFRGFSLSFAAGLGTRSPSVLERFIKLMPVQYDSYDYLGNPQLKPEQNYQADLAFEFHKGFIGYFNANFFFSFIHNYILGKILPPSVIKPSTQGAPGVKQFSNEGPVYLTGFECSYRSPIEKKWGVEATVAATYGTNPKAVRYITTGGSVTGEEIIKNDPLPEIPPLEGSLRVYYHFWNRKLVPRFSIRLVNAQNRVSVAFEEQKTPGFVTGSVSVSYRPCRYFSVTCGVENILNTPYYEHLNRRIVGSAEKLYEPGRIFFMNAGISF